MDDIFSFVVIVMANVITGVITYYICKLLDGNKKDKESGNQHEG